MQYLGFPAVVLVSLAKSGFALIYGVDSSTLVPGGTYSTAKGEGFTKAIIRAYEAWEGGGQVGPNFIDNNARATGITNIDAYLL